MCGFAVLAGDVAVKPTLDAMLGALDHRGPDGRGVWSSKDGRVLVGHNRLRIIDLDARSDQPFVSEDGRFVLAFNGEIYNYLELRDRLRGLFDFRTESDTEVLLAAFTVWGKACLDELFGMFAFVIWDVQKRECFGARDRFGVKPLYFGTDTGQDFMAASEIKAFHAVGRCLDLNEKMWSRYLQGGVYEDGRETFWRGVERLEPGHAFVWRASAGFSIFRWYSPDLTEDLRPEIEVAEELRAILIDAVRLRFRSDVEVGFLLSGGLDSSMVLSLASSAGVTTHGLHSYTFFSQLADYDETAWAKPLAEQFGVEPHLVELRAIDIPTLATQMQGIQDEPFGGFPTIAVGQIQSLARDSGVTVLLDGNGLDEAWAGYDYYQSPTTIDRTRAPVQAGGRGFRSGSLLVAEFAESGIGASPLDYSADPLRNAQMNDLFHAKLPRALRFSDRSSMAFSRELREPLLDHRLVELGLRQPASRKVAGGVGKWLVRKTASDFLPHTNALAPKRAVQSPQREWLSSDLEDWTRDRIQQATDSFGDNWFDVSSTLSELENFMSGKRDTSAHIWSLISLALTLDLRESRRFAASGQLK